MNAFKTTILLTLLTVILILAGEYFGGENGMILAFVIAAATNFFSYFYSDKIALAMYRAQPVTREQLPRAYDVVERLTQKAGLPMPKIYVIPTESPNAFATGRNPQHASVAVTHGILALLNDDELEGVLAHELGHVRNRDILTSSIAATLAGAITILARMAFWFGAFGGGGGGGRRDREGGLGALAMLILAPIAAVLIQLWVSRTREYEADASGAHLTGQSLRAGFGARKDLGGEPAGSAAGLADVGAFVYRGSAALRRNAGEPFQHASADSEAHRAIDRQAFGERVPALRWHTRQRSGSGWPKQDLARLITGP